MPKQVKQPRIGLLAAETTLSWGFHMYEATFPAGTLCRLAANQPARADGRLPYFIAGQPSSYKRDTQQVPKEAFDSWQDTYGFLVEPEAVVARVLPGRRKN